jgi:hypothetical protein
MVDPYLEPGSKVKPNIGHIDEYWAPKTISCLLPKNKIPIKTVH